MHNNWGRIWLSAALLLLLGLSSPLTWLASAAPRAMPCCCPQQTATATNALCAPCCYGQSAPASMSVAVVAPARATADEACAETQFALAVAAPTLAFAQFAAPRFPIEAALPPPRSMGRRIGSCRAPPANGGHLPTLQEGGKPT